jgi:Leucine-rich repeat (LRR) protein
LALRITLLKIYDLSAHYISEHIGNDIEDIVGFGSLADLEKLDPRNKIEEIKGLEHLINLKELSLRANEIREIKGLDNLTNLQKLDLRHNRIKEIRGLEKLSQLQELKIRANPIRSNESHLIGRPGQEFVKYCQEKTKR